nr:protein SPIRAL1-like 1 [Tanacetum cinerariifolium]
MNQGVNSDGGQSSLNYLFGGGEAPKPALKATQAAPCETPATNNVSATKPNPVSPPVDVTKQIHAGIDSNVSNNYFRADGQLERTIFKNLSLRHTSYSKRIESLERSKEKVSGQRESGLRKAKNQAIFIERGCHLRRVLFWLKEHDVKQFECYSPTLLSTPILNRGGYFGSRRGAIRRRFSASHRVRIRWTPYAASSPTITRLQPIYPGYIPLEDEHILLAEEQPLLPVVSPIAESPKYVAESDLEEDPEEYEDNETEDGPVDYPMDRGDDGDDDDGDSSRDDADDEEEDLEDGEEEDEHLAPADPAVVIPTDKLVSPPEETEPVIPPPSTDTATTGAKIIVRLYVTISFPPEAEGEIKKLEIELWNLKVKENNVPAYTERFQELTIICTKFVADETEKIDKYINGLPDNIYESVKDSKPKMLDETIELANELMDQKLRTYVERQTKERLITHSKTTMVTNSRPPKGKMSTWSTIWERAKGSRTMEICPSEPSAIFITMAHVPRRHFKRDCPKLKNKDGGKVNAPGWVYAVRNAEKRGNASRDPVSNVVT